MSAETIAIDEILNHLCTAPLDEYLLMPGLGALCVTKNQKSELIPSWASGQSLNTIADADQVISVPSPDSYEDLLSVFRDLDGYEAQLPQDHQSMFALASRVFDEVCRGQRGAIEGIGTFEVLQLPTGMNAMNFNADPGLADRIRSARASQS